MIPDRLAAGLAEHYRLDRELGTGGMAMVYLAHDLKHERDVAIKVLHPDLGAALGGERFLSEIRTTARLQHPHILPLLDSGQADGLLYYVMPLVTGETLRGRLERERQLPIPDAVRIAREVASALDYAHRQGVIHRDIKPENILLHDGQALVADFGIALAVQTAGGERMTQTGLSLGTPQYMSPEQAMGEKQIDARSDVYALAAVTYEMLTGDAPFGGGSVQAIVAKIMTEKPTPLRTLRDTVPEPVEAAVLAGLAKLPADRFPTAAGFAEALTSGTSGSPAAGPVRRSVRPSVRLAAMAATIIPLAGLAAWGWLRPGATTAAGGTIRAEIVVPDAAPVEFIGEATIGVGQTAIALSPDGRTLAYVGGGGSRPRLFVRALDRFEATPLPGTEGAFHPFFSPDGTWIGFFAENSLRKVPTAGGPVTTVAEAISPTAAVWTRGGDILFFPSLAGAVLRRVPAAGGQAERLHGAIGTACTKSLGLLPDDSWVLCTSASDQAYPFILAYSLDTGEHRVLVRSGEARAWQPSEPIPDDVLIGTTPLYRRDGTLLYTGPDGTLLSLDFDADGMRTSGEPIVVATGIRLESWTLQAQVAAAETGAIAYIPGADARVGVLAWLDRHGRVDTLRFPAANTVGTDVSPDGTRVAVAIPAVSGALELWLYDLRNGNRSRLLTNLGGSELRWTPDGRYVLAGIKGGVLVRLDPTRLGQLDTLARTSVWPAAVSSDGRVVLGNPGQFVLAGEDPAITYRVAMDGNRTAEPVELGRQSGGAYAPSFSPDARWVAYLGNAGGGVFVEPWPSTGEVYRISGELSGDVPYWSARGDEVFFPSQSQMYVTRVHAGTPPRFDPPELVAAQRFANNAGRPYAVAPDGQRFLIRIPSAEHSARSIRVELNAPLQPRAP